MGKSTEKLDNRSEEPKSDDETIKQALLYFKIANATGIPIEDRCKYLLKRGMREDDIDTMLAIIEQERLEKKMSNGRFVSIRLLRFMLVDPKN